MAFMRIFRKEWKKKVQREYAFSDLQLSDSLQLWIHARNVCGVDRSTVYLFDVRAVGTTCLDDVAILAMNPSTAPNAIWIPRAP